MCNRRYIVFGGYVKSNNDLDTHYIPAISVMNLYGLKRSQCFLIETNCKEITTQTMLGLAESHPHRYHYLYPDPTGKYICPKGEPMEPIPSGPLLIWIERNIPI